MFLFRRRKLENALVREREVIAKLEDFKKQGICKATIHHQVILAGQEKKFKDFSITKAEIADYFRRCRISHYQHKTRRRSYKIHS